MMATTRDEAAKAGPGVVTTLPGQTSSPHGGEEDSTSPAASTSPPAVLGSSGAGAGAGLAPLPANGARTARKRFLGSLGALTAVDEVDESALISPAQPTTMAKLRSGRRLSLSDAPVARAPPAVAVDVTGVSMSPPVGGDADHTVPRARRASTGTITIPRLTLAGSLDSAAPAPAAVVNPLAASDEPTAAAAAAGAPARGVAATGITLKKPHVGSTSGDGTAGAAAAGVTAAGTGVVAAGAGDAVAAAPVPVVTLQQLDTLDSMLSGMGLLARVCSRAKLTERFDAETAAALSGVGARGPSSHRAPASARGMGVGFDSGVDSLLAAAEAAVASSGTSAADRAHHAEVPPLTARRSNLVAALTGNLTARVVDSDTGKAVDAVALTARLGAPDAPPSIRAAGLAAAGDAAAAATYLAAMSSGAGSGRSSASGAGSATSGRPPLSGGSPFRRPLAMGHSDSVPFRPLALATPTTGPHPAPPSPPPPPPPHPPGVPVEVAAMEARLTVLEAALRDGNAAVLRALAALSTSAAASCSGDPAQVVPSRGLLLDAPGADKLHARPALDPPSARLGSSEGTGATHNPTPPSVPGSARGGPATGSGGGAAYRYVRLCGSAVRLDALVLAIAVCVLQVITLAFAAAAFRAVR